MEFIIWGNLGVGLTGEFRALEYGGRVGVVGDRCIADTHLHTHEYVNKICREIKTWL